MSRLSIYLFVFCLWATGVEVTVAGSSDDYNQNADDFFNTLINEFLGPARDEDLQFRVYDKEAGAFAKIVYEGTNNDQVTLRYVTGPKKGTRRVVSRQQRFFDEAVHAEVNVLQKNINGKKGLHLVEILQGPRTGQQVTASDNSLRPIPWNLVSPASDELKVYNAKTGKRVKLVRFGYQPLLGAEIAVTKGGPGKQVVLLLDELEVAKTGDAEGLPSAKKFVRVKSVVEKEPKQSKLQRLQGSLLGRKPRLIREQVLSEPLEVVEEFHSGRLLLADGQIVDAGIVERDLSSARVRSSSQGSSGTKTSLGRCNRGFAHISGSK